MSWYKSLLSVGLLTSTAHVGHSTPVSLKELQRRVDCDDISKYSVDYFMGTKIREPEATTCLFYTAYLSADAKKYAHSGGASMTTIWDIWSCDHYNGDQVDDNRLRCIFEDDGTREEYFAHMSEAMAISCDNFATVMTDDTGSIPQNGIWGRVERPALERSGNPGGTVDSIIAIEKNGDNIITVWRRDGTRKAMNVTVTPTVEKRQDEGVDRCYSPDEIQEWFGTSVPW